MVKDELDKKINESNGIIDDRFLALADWIIKRASHGVKKNRWGEKTFTVPSNVFKKFNIYNLPFNNLKVEITSDGNDHVRGGGIFGGPELCLRNDTIWSEDKSVIAHELVHIIQSKGDGGKNKSNAQGHYTLDRQGKEETRNIAYDFDPKELQARISEAGTFLRTSAYSPKRIKMALEKRYGTEYIQKMKFSEFYDFVLTGLFGYHTDSLKGMLRFYDMEASIEKIELDKVSNFVAGLNHSIRRFSGQNDFYSKNYCGPVFGLFLTRPWYLEEIIPNFKKLLGKPKKSFKNGNWYSEYETPPAQQTAMWFVVLKNKLLSYFESSFAEYKKKVSKSLAPIIKEIYDNILQNNPDF